MMNSEEILDLSQYCEHDRAIRPCRFGRAGFSV